MHLPDWTPKLKKMRAPGWFDASGYTSIRPKIQNYPGVGSIVDWYLDRNKHVIVKVLPEDDHPSINDLPPNCPRVVRAIYKKPFQMRFARATHADACWPEIEKAEAALVKFLRNSRICA